MKIMALLESLYNAGKEKYPIYHSGILAFVITTFLPLNFGLSRLPPLEVFLLLIVGFASLFMLARNEKVGNGFLHHLKIKKYNYDFIATESTTRQSNSFRTLSSHEDPPQDLLILLQNVFEHIIITHDDDMDLSTRMELGKMQRKLQSVARQLCTLEN